MFRRLFALSCAIAALCLPLRAQVPGGFLSVTQTNFVDTNGAPVSNAAVCAQVMIGGKPSSIRVGVGTTTVSQVCTTVTAGKWSMNLPDMSISSPKYACVAFTAVDNTSGDNIMPRGFGCVQPRSVPPPNVSTFWCTSGGCNFDLLDPFYPASEVIQEQPGPQGPTGCNIGTTCSSSLAGVPVDAYANFAAAVAACGTTSPCDLVTSAPIAVTAQVLPANIIPRFLPGGQWVSGAVGTTVGITSGHVIAPPDQQIFNNVSASSLQEANASWFASPSGNIYPEAALTGAISGTVTNGRVNIGNALYKSAYNNEGTEKDAPARTLVGVGNPHPDVEGITATRCVPGSGSIILGPFIMVGTVAEFPRISNVCVDAGSWYDANVLGHQPTGYNGLIVVAGVNGVETPGGFASVEHVTVVSTPKVSNHAFLFEGWNGCVLRTLRVYVPVSGTAAVNDGWGDINKSQNCYYGDIEVWGATDGGVYDKSDHNPAVGNGHSSNNTYDGVSLHGGQWRVEAVSDNNDNTTVNNLHIDAAPVGIFEMSVAPYDLPGYMHGWKFNNVTMTNMTGPCFYMFVSTDTQVNNWSCGMAAQQSFGAVYIAPGVTHPVFTRGIVHGFNDSTHTGQDAFQVIGNGDKTKGGVISGFFGDNLNVGFRASSSAGADGTAPTGTVAGWTITDFHSTNLFGPSIYLDNASDVTVSIAEGTRTTADANGVFFVGTNAKNIFMRDLTARGSGVKVNGVVSNAALTLVDHLYCDSCAYTAYGTNTATKSLRLHGVFFGSTPTSGTAPYYTFSGNTMADSTSVSDF